MSIKEELKQKEMPKHIENEEDLRVVCSSRIRKVTMDKLVALAKKRKRTVSNLVELIIEKRIYG